MSKIFDVSELLQVAIEDEKSGAAFYAVAADRVSRSDLGDRFRKLAEQELGHQKRFEDMLRSIGDFAAPESYPAEYQAYVHALTRDRAFPGVDAARAQATGAGGDAALVSAALDMERKTLMLLNEMRRFTPDRHREILDDITQEEQSHLIALLEARISLVS